MISLIRKKWEAALDECDSHILRIQHAIDHLADKLPLSISMETTGSIFKDSIPHTVARIWTY
jgi:hypothetical protein